MERLLQRRPDGVQHLFQPLAIFADERVRGSQDLRCRAIVGVEQKRLCPGVPAFKLEDKLHVGPAPGVDRLVGISHHEEVFVVARQDVRQLVLILVNVLELVHHHVLQPFLPLFAHLAALLERVERKIDDVVEVKPVALALLVEIAVEHLVLERRRRLLEPAQTLGIHVDERFHVAAAAFAPADVVRRVLNGHLARRDVQLLKNAAQHCGLVLLIEHNEGRGVLQNVAVLLQQSHAEAVERRDLREVLVRQHLPDALFHLGRGLVRKGHAENVRRRDAQRLNQIQKPRRERLGLARACARDHAHIALGRLRGRLLLFVQPFQYGFHGRIPFPGISEKEYSKAEVP